jgi:hypothetical protein
MRTVMLAGATLALLAAATAVQAADVYVPGPAYGAAPPPYQAVPGFVEAPPPSYAPLPPPAAYPVPPQYGYGAPGYGPQPGYVYSGPPVAAYSEYVEEVLPPAWSYGVPIYTAPVYAQGPRAYRQCWWEAGRRFCGVRRGW